RAANPSCGWSNNSRPTHGSPADRPRKLGDTTMNARMEVLGPQGERFDEILTPEALRFLARLHESFVGRRHEALTARMERRRGIENGRDLDFLPETRAIREDPDWRVAG